MTVSHSRATIATAILLFVISVLMVGGGVLYIFSRQPPSPVIVLHSSVRTSMITVYITGAVTRPGMYQIAASARIIDLLNAAGGPLTGADLQQVDLAQSLTDGEEIVVPRIGEAVTLSQTNGSSTQTILLNVNTASAAELHAQLHMSLKMANTIVAYRAKHGPFRAITDLLHVPISSRTLKRIQPMITLGG